MRIDSPTLLLLFLTLSEASFGESLSEGVGEIAKSELVFVGRVLEMKEIPQPSCPAEHLLKPDDPRVLDCVSLDTQFMATYQVLAVLEGEPQSTVTFDVFSHMTPHFHETGHSLLFLSLEERERPLLRKDMAFPMYRSRDTWVYCDPNESGVAVAPEAHLENIEVLDVPQKVLDDEVWSGVLERSGGIVRCRSGIDYRVLYKAIRAVNAVHGSGGES